MHLSASSPSTTRLTCITATLPSLYSLWFHNTTSFSTPAKALSFPLPNSFAVTSSQQFRGGIKLITFLCPPRKIPQSQASLNSRYNFMSITWHTDSTSTLFATQDAAFPVASFTAKTTFPTNSCGTAHTCTTPRSSNTFLDKEVFHVLDLPPLHHHFNTYNHTLHLLPHYRWSMRKWGKIPIAYILPKRKKSFTKGRPIVSFVGAMLRSLTSDLADVIYLMLRQACPDALGRGDTLHQLQSLRQAFHTHHHNPPEEQFSLHILQPGPGFFTSISTDRFLASLRLMTYWYKNKNPNHATTFTCTHHEPDPTMQVHRGRSRFQKPHRHTIHLNHLPDICQAVLLLNYCMVGNTLLQQTRGAPMGSPASPALCDMVVAVCEQSWTHTYRNITYNVKHCQSKQFTLSGFFATRYVDNRLTLLPTCTTHLSHFFTISFTPLLRHPDILRDRTGLDYLGFTINPTQHSIHYKATANLTDILSPNQHHRTLCYVAASGPAPFGTTFGHTTRSSCSSHGAAV